MEEVPAGKRKNESYGVLITECLTRRRRVVKYPETDGKIKIDQVWAVMDYG
jgi:hypothetical protein